MASRKGWSRKKREKKRKALLAESVNCSNVVEVFCKKPVPDDAPGGAASGSAAAAASMSDKGDMMADESGSRSEEEKREEELVEEESLTQTVGQEMDAAVTPAPAIAATSRETAAPVTEVIQDEYNYFKRPKSNTLDFFFIQISLLMHKNLSSNHTDMKMDHKENG